MPDCSVMARGRCYIDVVSWLLLKAEARGRLRLFFSKIKRDISLLRRKSGGFIWFTGQNLVASVRKEVAQELNNEGLPCLL